MTLKDLRKSKGLSQTTLASMCGVTRQCICGLESENSKTNPSVKLAKKLAEALDVNWTIFFEDEGKSNLQEIQTEEVGN